MRHLIRPRKDFNILSRIFLRFQSTLREQYPFPTKLNASPYEIFHLPQEASPADIKTRYFELVRQYHPDAFQGRNVTPTVIESRFHAITNAYNILTQRTGSEEGGETALDPEAQKIKERLAAWAAADARRPTSVYDNERRQRALDAEAAVGRWFKSDFALYYLLTGAVVAVAVMQFQGRPSTHKERVRKYIEIRKPDNAQ